MDPNGSGDGLEGWSLGDIKRYLTLQRYLPKNGGLFRSGWARFMADQETAGNGTKPPSFMPNLPQKPLAIPPWATPPIMPQAPGDASPFNQPRWSGSAALTPGRVVPASLGLEGANLPGAGFSPSAGAPTTYARGVQVSSGRQTAPPLGGAPQFGGGSGAASDAPFPVSHPRKRRAGSRALQQRRSFASPSCQLAGPA